MSFSGKKNLFTLNQTNQSNDPLKRIRDPFAKDPFKVQSYNFRYADPPSFPLKSPFDTNDKCDNAKTNFHESRQRQFVQSDYGRASTTINGSHKSNTDAWKTNIRQQPPKVYTDYTRPYYQHPAPYNLQPQSPNVRMSFPNGGTSNMRFEPAKRGSFVGAQSYGNCPYTSPAFKRSNSSLCQININIQQNENALPQEQLVINIGTTDNTKLCTGNSPYSSNSMVLPSEASSNFHRQNQQAAHSSPKTRIIVDSLNDTLFSSDSSSTSEYDSYSKRMEIERMPKRISVLKSTETSSSSHRLGQSRSKTASCQPLPLSYVSPYLGVQKQEVIKQAVRKNSVVVEKRSTQTLVNNLNTDDTTKSRTIMTRNAQKSLENLKNGKLPNMNFKNPQERNGLDRRRENGSNVRKATNNVTTSVSHPVSAISLQKARSSASRNSGTENSPLLVNINYYKKSNSP